MRRTVLTAAGLLLALCAVPATQAAPWPDCSCCPYCYPPPPPRPPAPDACGPGSYCTGICGMTYGPNYYLRPPFPPFNGMLPPPSAVLNGNGRGPFGPGSPVFPAHPYARSPRDYFMTEGP
jgi:hypothetical protein